MKKLSVILLCVLLAASLIACTIEPTATPSSGTSAIVVSNATKALNTVAYSGEDITSLRDDDYKQKVTAFSNNLYAMCGAEAEGNYAFSPLSVYMALAMLYSVGDAGVKADIAELFGMTDADIAKTGALFLDLLRVPDEYSVATLDINNSIWLDTQLTANQAALDRLADDYFCRAYQTPFATDNKQANADIRAFVKQLTNGLIDKDFDLQSDTLVALINTLYFKDCWANEGLDLLTEQRKFTGAKSTVTTEFLLGNYSTGLVQKTDTCAYYQMATDGGFSLKLILPNEGYTVADVMTADTLNAVCATRDYGGYADKDMHRTRCIFPSFRIDCDTPLKDILEAGGYLGNAFGGFASDLLTDTPLAVSDIQHRVAFNVDKQGIEGAAVTIVSMKNTSVGPGAVTYHDFVLDRPFGFLLTDGDGVVLFAGQVTSC